MLRVGKFDSATVSGVPAGSVGPSPTQKRFPFSTCRSAFSATCGDETTMLPVCWTTTSTCCSATGQTCDTWNSELSKSSVKPTWTLVVPGANGPSTVSTSPLTEADSLESGSSAAPCAAARQIDHQRSADIDAPAGVVDDLQQVEHPQLIVVELHVHAAVAADDHGAAGWRRRERSRLLLRLALGRARNAGHENHFQPASSRHHKRQGLQGLAVNRRQGTRLSAGRQARELGETLCVCRRRPRHAANGDADLLPGDVVADRFARDAHGHGAIRELGGGKRATVDLAGVRHVLR